MIARFIRALGAPRMPAIVRVRVLEARLAIAEAESGKLTKQRDAALVEAEIAAAGEEPWTVEQRAALGWIDRWIARGSDVEAAWQEPSDDDWSRGVAYLVNGEAVTMRDGEGCYGMVMT